jgi:hypothetical protein
MKSKASTSFFEKKEAKKLLIAAAVPLVLVRPNGDVRQHRDLRGRRNVRQNRPSA